MARIRTIKPEFWESETIGTLSFGARLLFLACLNMADDEGLLRWNPSYLQSNAFVYDEVEHSQILEWMGELENGFVFPYQAGKTNQKLAWIINFRNHQVINRPQPSKLPGPSIQNSKFRDAIYERDKNICHLCGNEVVRHERTNISGSKAPSIDHIKPQSKGGSDYPSNLKTAHISCNKSRGNDDMNDSVSDSVNESVNDSVAERKGKEEEKEKDLTAAVVTESVSTDSDQPTSQPPAAAIPKPPPETEQQKRLRLCFQEREPDIRHIYPHADYVPEMETCIAHYRNGPALGPDVYPTILKWFNRIRKPEPEQPRAVMSPELRAKVEAARIEMAAERRAANGA